MDVTSYNKTEKYTLQHFEQCTLRQLISIVRQHMKFAVKNLNKKTKEEIALEMYTFHNKRLQELYTTREEEKEEENKECEEKIDSVVEKQNNQEEKCIILKQFEHFNIPIYGTYEEPLFRATDIGKVLEMTNIHMSINDFDEKDDISIIYTTDSIGRKQKAIMLTEFGVYKLLFISRKPIAKKFQKWTFDVLKTIRLTGSYNLQTQLETERQEKLRIEQEKEQLQLQLYQRPSLDLVFQNRIVNEQYKTEYIYIITSKQYAEQKIFKVGRTNDTKKRLVSLNTSNITDNQQLYVCDKFPCFNACKVEETLFLILHNYRYTTKREFFVFNYHSLKKLVECVCIHNKQQYELFHDIINTEQHQLIPSYIPPPLSTHYNTNDTKKTKIDQFFSNV